MNTQNPNASGGRLQRPAAVDGAHISTFRQVVYRHGLAMGSMALVLALLPSAYDQVARTTTQFMDNPAAYLLAGALLLSFFVVYQTRKGNRTGPANNLWLIYLLYISVVEELAFRLFLPIVLKYLHVVLAIRCLCLRSFCTSRNKKSKTTTYYMINNFICKLFNFSWFNITKLLISSYISIY